MFRIRVHLLIEKSLSIRVIFLLQAVANLAWPWAVFLSFSVALGLNAACGGRGHPRTSAQQQPLKPSAIPSSAALAITRAPLLRVVQRMVGLGSPRSGPHAKGAEGRTALKSGSSLPARSSAAGEEVAERTSLLSTSAPSGPSHLLKGRSPRLSANLTSPAPQWHPSLTLILAMTIVVCKFLPDEYSVAGFTCLPDSFTI